METLFEPARVSEVNSRIRQSHPEASGSGAA